MSWISRNRLTGLLGCAGVLAGTAAALAYGTLPEEKSSAERDASWVEKRVEDWQPTRQERAFDEIGWAKDLRQAERLAGEHGRPIFLFTYSGANMAGFRC